MTNSQHKIDASVPAILFALDKLDYDDIFTLADDWLNQGIYLESLNYIFMDSVCPDVEFSNPCKNYDKASLFKQALNELGFEIPRRDEAVLSLVNYKIQQILDGSLDITKGATYIYYDIYTKYSDYFEKGKYIGESMGLGLVFCWLRELGDCRERTRLLYFTDLPRDMAEEKILEELREALKSWSPEGVKSIM